MEFRRGGHRDERRRRVLIDETPGAEQAGEAPQVPTESAAESTGGEPARRYSDGALSTRQPRIIDLIPSRCWTRLVLSGLLLSALAGCEAIFGYVALGHARIDVSLLPAVDLTTRGSVLTWFSAALLAASAGMGLLTYQIRRHRVDDYRGRYHIWCWLVPLLFVASVDQVAGLQETLRTALLHITGLTQLSNVQLIWVGSLAAVITIVVARLVVEMRACGVAVGLLVMAWACHVGGAAGELGWWVAEPGVLRTMALSTLVVGGHIACFLGLSVYAGHVYREADGQLQTTSPAKRVRPQPRRVPKPVKKAAPVTEKPTREAASGLSATDKQVRVDGSHTPEEKPAAAPPTDRNRPATPARKRLDADLSSATSRTKSTPPASVEEEQQGSDSGLSKAERRRLRKLQRREQAS